MSFNLFVAKRELNKFYILELIQKRMNLIVRHFKFLPKKKGQALKSFDCSPWYGTIITVDNVVNTNTNDEATKKENLKEFM